MIPKEKCKIIRKVKRTIAKTHSKMSQNNLNKVVPDHRELNAMSKIPQNKIIQFMKMYLNKLNQTKTKSSNNNWKIKAKMSSKQ